MPAAARLDIIAQAQDQVSAVMSRVSKSLKTTGKDAKRLAGEVGQAEAGFNSARMAMAKARAGMKATAGRVEALGARLSKLGPAALGVGAAFAALGAAMTAGRAGAMYEARLTRLGDSAGEVEARLRSLQQAAGGGFSVAQLAQFEATQKELGIAINLTGEELGKLDALFISLGREGGVALNDLARAVGGGEPGLLKQLGLVEDLEARWAAYAKAQGKSTEQLTRVEKGNLAITAMREGLQGVDAAVGSTAGKWGAFFAAISDVGAMLQQVLAPLVHILEPVGVLLQKLALLLKSALQPVLAVVGRLLGGVLSVVGSLFGALLDLLRIALMPVIWAMRELAELFGADEAAKDLDNTLQAMTTSTEANTDATEDNAAAQQEAAAAVAQANKERERAKLLIDSETKATARASDLKKGTNESMIAQLRIMREEVDAGTRAFIDQQIVELEKANATLDMERKITAEREKTTAAIDEQRAAIEALEASKPSVEGETAAQQKLGEEYEALVVKLRELEKARTGSGDMADAAVATQLESVNAQLDRNHAAREKIAAQRKISEREINDQIKARQGLIAGLESAQEGMDSAIRGATRALIEQMGLGGKKPTGGGGGKSRAQRRRDLEAAKESGRIQREMLTAEWLAGEDERAKLAAKFQAQREELENKLAKRQIKRADHRLALEKLEQQQKTATLALDKKLEEAGINRAAADRKAQENNAISLQMQRVRLGLMRAEEPAARAKLELDMERLRIEQELLRAGTDEISQAHAREMARVKMAMAQERYNRAMEEAQPRNAAAAKDLAEFSQAMEQAGGPIASMDSKIGALASGTAKMSNVWSAYNAGQGEVQDAVAGTVGAVGAAAQQFTDDAALQAGIGMAMEIANAASAGASMNFPKMAAHMVAAGLYGAVIAQASGGGGGGATATGTAGGMGPQASNQGPGGGDGGGFGEGAGEGRTVIVQFGSGVVLGRPQDVAKGVAQAANSARNTGTERARY